MSSGQAMVAEPVGSGHIGSWPAHKAVKTKEDTKKVKPSIFSRIVSQFNSASNATPGTFTKKRK
jgi:hypothetical protein